MTLFDNPDPSEGSLLVPLSERMRPKTLADFFGQDHLTGPGAMIRRFVESDRLFSLILWGPPGCGKTTLAGIIAAATRSHFMQFSAVLSGVKEIREVLDEARRQRQSRGRQTLLFVDEIHRFNKGQQDAFLQHVENGLITLIGATTENPSFEVIAPLLSRCKVIALKPLSPDALRRIIARALTDADCGLGCFSLTLSPETEAGLVRVADGDARAALNHLEMAAHLTLAAGSRRIDPAHLEAAVSAPPLRYDKAGDAHFDLISALHKSLRGSDPDAAVYWLGRMLGAGENPLYVARRMVRFASEDVGNADPYALRVALDAVESYRFLGSPEGDLALAQAAVYLATAPKSNRVYAAANAVRDAIAETGSLPVPLHIRNAPTRLMAEMGHGKGYRYAHDYPDAFVAQTYLPEAISGRRFYVPSDQGYERAIQERLDQWRSRTESRPPPGRGRSGEEKKP